MMKENKMEKFIHEMMVFFVSTSCVCICEGVFGMIFFRDAKVDMGAFFSPPLFGLISVAFGMIAGINAKKDMSVKEVLLRQLLHLFLIEAAVFGLNAVSKLKFKMEMAIPLFFAIAFIYLIVHVVLLLNDRRSATLFNEQLKNYQKKYENE
jgi:hypothetical protein